MLIDDSIMPFGKYKGKKLSEIPDGWWTWMYDRSKLSKQYIDYAEDRVNILRFIRDKRLADEKKKET